METMMPNGNGKKKQPAKPNGRKANPVSKSNGAKKNGNGSKESGFDQFLDKLSPIRRFRG
jgi:hypothetical protein